VCPIGSGAQGSMALRKKARSEVREVGSVWGSAVPGCFRSKHEFGGPDRGGDTSATLVQVVREL
jgi:hypothetical protein